MLSKAFILVSPNLPIGSFSYSQALETCVEEKLITCSEDFEKWLAANLKHSLQTCDLP
ncbi:MAG TPA: urease accessory protein UreF, partial [Succinivibrio sp.]|nr:urease accessory protein UreF [Succinivibrio sp.]